MKNKTFLSDKNGCSQGLLIPRESFFPEVPKLPFRVRCVQDRYDFDELVEGIEKNKWFSFDTETTNIKPRQAQLVGMSFCFNVDEAWYLPLQCPKGEKYLSTAGVLINLSSIFLNNKIKKIGQNIKYDKIVLRNYDIDLRGISFDTLIASYLVDAGSRRHNLDLLAKKYLAYETIKLSSLIGSGKNQLGTKDIPLECMAAYAAEDAWVVAKIAPILYEEIERQQLVKLLEHVEIPLIDVLAEMEFNGIFIDQEKVDELRRDFETKIDRNFRDIRNQTNSNFNPNSTKQLRHELFVKRKLRPVKATKSGNDYSTDGSVLETLSEGQNDGHEFVKKISKHRELNKLYGTYIAPIDGIIYAETRRIHCSFNQAVTATGRLSCSDPNLQNIPARAAEGKEIRKIFSAPKDHLLIAADYSQIELRVLAHYSDDPVLIKAFQDDEDIHLRVASQMKKCPIEEITKEIRDTCKQLNFGVIYGQGPKRLAKSLGVSYDEAKSFINMYFTEFPAIKKCRSSIIKKCARLGYVKTILGRRRYIDGLFSPEWSEKSEAERQAFNTVIQGSAADIIKLAMLECHKLIKEGLLHAKMLLQIHDELVFEVHKNAVTEVSKLVNQVMQNVIQLKVPMKVDVEIGKSWGEVK